MNYFNRDFALKGFESEKQLESCLNHFLRTEVDNESVRKNECYMESDPNDVGIFEYNQKNRIEFKNHFFHSWRTEWNHLYFANIECLNPAIQTWNDEMYQEMWNVIHFMMRHHYYSLLAIVHKDIPNTKCHFYVLFDYIHVEEDESYERR